MESRKHPLAHCEDCPLQDRGKYVPSWTPDSGREVSLAIVGEVPGVQEAARGVPFTGPSGKLLELTLQHHGLTKQEAFLSNAVSCRPAGNATPSPDAIAACRPRLVHELQESGCRDVLALGNTAARSLLDTRIGITQLRQGSGRTSSRLPGVRIVPTIHPAAALRHSDSFPDIVADVGKLVAKESRYVPIDWHPWDLFSGYAAIEVLEAFLQDYKGKPVSIDIEAGIEKDGAGGFGHPSRFDLLCIGISYDDGKAFIVDLRRGSCAREVLEHLYHTLKVVLSNIKIIAQNGKFDLEGLYRITKGSAELWFDTMLAHYCMDERAGSHGLETMGIEYLNAPSWKDVLKPYLDSSGSYASIPMEILSEYCARDTAITYQLYKLFDEMLERKDLRHVHDFLVAASNQLVYLELNGVGIDIDYLNIIDADYQKSLAALRQKIQELTGIPTFNPGSPQQVKKYLESIGVRVGSTDKDHMRGIIERAPQGHAAVEFAKLKLSYAEEAKQHGTYVKGLRKRLYGNRLFTTYLLHGTTSGRLASRNPNLQNIPRDVPGRASIRRMFVPTKPENVFVQADYSQAELRVMAALSGDTFLTRVFEDDRDIHSEWSDSIYGPGNWGKNERVRVKAFVFGSAYGREAPSIAEEYGIPLDEALRIQKLFFSTVPDLVRWRQDVKAQIRANKQLVTPFGRRRRFWLITRENQDAIMREGLAFLPQSTASDICLGAATELRQTLRGRAFLRLLVHDSILVECHMDDSGAVSELMTEAMVRHGEKILPQVKWKVDVNVGKSWQEV